MIMIMDRKNLLGKKYKMEEIGRWMAQAAHLRPRRRAARPGRWASLALLGVLGALALAFYRRTRKQVADRYSMGEPEGAWGGEQIPTGDAIPAR